MKVVAFDTLEFADKLTNAGMRPEIAHVLVGEIEKILSDLMINQNNYKDKV